MRTLKRDASSLVVDLAAVAVLLASAVTGGAASVPASTLSPPKTAEMKPAPDGFIRRWLVLEPIATTGLTDSIVQAAVKKGPFVTELSAVPGDGEKVNVESAQLTWHAVDTSNYNLNLFHFARSLDKNTSNVLFWVVTVVHAPREIRDVRLAIGSNAASVWWVNGQEVIGIYGDRQTVIDDGVSKRLTLKKGPNVIRAAVVNGGGATDFCARILDASDKPLTDFVVNLHP
jgi:hypothetical protein